MVIEGVYVIVVHERFRALVQQLVLISEFFY